MNEGDGHLSLNATTYGSGAWTVSIWRYSPLRADVIPGGGFMIFWYVARTSREVIALPLWNFTPSRSLRTYVRLSDETVQDVARSATTRVPVGSSGSMRNKVL